MGTWPRKRLRIHARNAFCRVKTASLKGYKLADSICRLLLQRQDLGEPGWVAATPPKSSQASPWSVCTLQSWGRPTHVEEDREQHQQQVLSRLTQARALHRRWKPALSEAGEDEDKVCRPKQHPGLMGLNRQKRDPRGLLASGEEAVCPPRSREAFSLLPLTLRVISSAYAKFPGHGVSWAQLLMTQAGFPKSLSHHPGNAP